MSHTIKFKKKYIQFYIISIFISLALTYTSSLFDKEIKITNCNSIEVRNNYETILDLENYTSLIHKYLKTFINQELSLLSEDENIIINENFITFNPLNCKENYEYVMEKLTLIKANVYEEYKKLYSFIQSNQEDDKKILSGTDALVVLKSNSENILAFIVRNKTSVINQNEYYVLIIRFLIILLLLNVIYYLFNKISLKFY